MSLTHDQWRERVFGFEELDVGERAETERHLAECESCRRLRDTLLASQREGAQPEADRMGVLPLSEVDRAAEAATAHETLVHDAAQGPRVHQGWWIAGAAAVAAVAFMVLLPRPTPSPGPPAPSGSPLGAVAIEHVPETRVGASDEWHTGDAFRLNVVLDRPARPLVWRVGPDGAISRLEPRSLGATLAEHPAGLRALPPAGSDVRWRLEGAPGLVTFLVVAVHAGFDLAALEREIAALPAGAREARVAALHDLLAARADSVEEVRLEHRP